MDLPYLDSLNRLAHQEYKRVLRSPPTLLNDSLRFRALNYLGRLHYWWPGHRDSTLYFSRELIRQAKERCNIEFEVKGILLEEFYYHSYGKNYVEALRLNYKARDVLQKAGQDPEMGWRVDLNLGELYIITGDYVSALRFLTNAQILIEKGSGIGKTATNGYKAQMEQNIALIYDKLTKFSESEMHYLRALDFATTTSNRANIYDDLSKLYLKYGQYGKAIEYGKKAEPLWESISRPIDVVNTWALLASSYVASGQYESALWYANSVLATNQAQPSIRRQIHYTLHQAYEQQNQWKNSLQHYKQYIALRDSINDERQINELLRLQKKNELERLAIENQQQQQVQAERLTTVQKQAELDRIRSQARADALIQKSLLTEQLRLVENERAQNTMTRLQTQQKLQRQTYEQRTLLQQRAYEQETTLQQRARTWLLSGLMGVLLFTIALATVYRQNRRQKGQIEQMNIGLEQTVQTRTAQLQQANDELRQKNQTLKEFSNRIQATEMAALRSQMNPHFIFNCLNSIQYFTAQNDAEKASDYLAKFSRLIRLVLENSKSERVTLANELETLRLYIEMEAMRFQDKVHYSIEVPESIDTDMIQMPPLLLQPFVENAIWHGLMHKEEGGTVRIIVQQPTENLLHVEITDDGVGRVKAGEYKSKSATKNKSFGMKMTAERIELINQLYHTQTQVQLIDLVDSQGRAMGTRVVVDIPLTFS